MFGKSFNSVNQNISMSEETMNDVLYPNNVFQDNKDQVFAKKVGEKNNLLIKKQNTNFIRLSKMKNNS